MSGSPKGNQPGITRRVFAGGMVAAIGATAGVSPFIGTRLSNAQWDARDYDDIPNEYSVHPTGGNPESYYLQPVMVIPADGILPDFALSLSRKLMAEVSDWMAGQVPTGGRHWRTADVIGQPLRLFRRNSEIDVNGEAIRRVVGLTAEALRKPNNQTVRFLALYFGNCQSTLNGGFVMGNSGLGTMGPNVSGVPVLSRAFIDPKVSKTKVADFSMSNLVEVTVHELSHLSGAVPDCAGGIGNHSPDPGDIMYFDGIQPKEVLDRDDRYFNEGCRPEGMDRWFTTAETSGPFQEAYRRFGHELGALVTGSYPIASRRGTQFWVQQWENGAASFDTLNPQYGFKVVTGAEFHRNHASGLYTPLDVARYGLQQASVSDMHL